MKNWWIFVYLITLANSSAQQDSRVILPPEARIAQMALDAQSVTVLHLRPGYVSSVRVPEDVSSVALGNPAAFKVEHSDAEPRLVFLKPMGLGTSETNALITTKNGHQISLQLISSGSANREGVVDFVLEYTKPRGIFIDVSRPSLVVAETRVLSPDPVTTKSADSAPVASNQELLRQQVELHPHWQGKELRVAVGRITENEQQMVVAFSVLNDSSKTVDLLPPQVQLAGTSKERHGKLVKADQVPIKDYVISARRLPPHARADAVVTFERPAFKESKERMLLQLAQAEKVDRPTLVPIPFVAPIEGGSR